MSSLQKFPQVILADFFNQFPTGINSSVVVTPNRRLAKVLRREFDGLAGYSRHAQPGVRLIFFR